MAYSIKATITINLPLAGRTLKEIRDRAEEADRAIADIKAALHESNVEATEPALIMVRARDPEPAATTLDLQAADMPQGHTDAAPQANADDAKPAAAPDDDSGFEIPPSLRRGK